MTIKEEIQIEEYKRTFAEAYKQGFIDAMSVCKTEPTISKMEQVDKDINVRSKDCETCKHYKLACELFSEVCKYEPITKTETQNSNLTFEKVMEEIQTQVIEFPDTHQKFIFARKIEMDGDSIKICGWEYKGVKDGEREGE